MSFVPEIHFEIKRPFDVNKLVVLMMSLQMTQFVCINTAMFINNICSIDLFDGDVLIPLQLRYDFVSLTANVSALIIVFVFSI